MDRQFFPGYRKTGKDHLLELMRLARNRVGDLWMRMAVDIDPPGRDRVDQFPTIAGVQKRALTAFDTNRFGIQGSLSVGMPELHTEHPGGNNGRTRRVDIHG